MLIVHLRDNIKSDLLRYTGKRGLLVFIRAFWKYPGFRYSFYQRHCYYYQSQNSLNYKLRYTFYNFFLKIIGNQTDFRIHYKNRFGKGLMLPTAGPIEIGDWVIFGHNINLSPGLKIKIPEQEGDSDSVPTFGSMIHIGENVTLEGIKSIGNNVVIAPNSVVITDIPDNSLVAGKPAVVSPLNGTNNYINRPVKPHKTRTTIL